MADLLGECRNLFGDISGELERWGAILTAPAEPDEEYAEVSPMWELNKSQSLQSAQSTKWCKWHECRLISHPREKNKMLKGAVLYAKSLENLTQFYLQFGGQITGERKGEFSAITNRGSELIILQAPSEIASQIVINDPPAIRSATPLKPILETSSIEDTLHEILKFGGRPVPGAKLWKFRQYLVQDIVDPEGNVVQLWQSE